MVFTAFPPMNRSPTSMSRSGIERAPGIAGQFEFRRLHDGRDGQARRCRSRRTRTGAGPVRRNSRASWSGPSVVTTVMALTGRPPRTGRIRCTALLARIVPPHGVEAPRVGGRGLRLNVGYCRGHRRGQHGLERQGPGPGLFSIREDRFEQLLQFLHRTKPLYPVRGLPF